MDEEYFLFDHRIDEKGLSIVSLQLYLKHFSESLNKTKINILITSPGGSLGAVMARLQDVQDIIEKNKIDVKIINIGKVESAAVTLFTGVSSNRFYLKETSFLIHSTFSTKNSDPKVIDTLNDYQCKIISDSTNMDFSDLQKRLKNKEEINIVDQEIQDFGIAHLIDSLDIVKKKVIPIPSNPIDAYFM